MAFEREGTAMLKYWLARVIVVVALAGGSEAFGQEATEMYIPIGQSPAVPSKSTVLSTIEPVDPGKRRLTGPDAPGCPKLHMAAPTLLCVGPARQEGTHKT